MKVLKPYDVQRADDTLLVAFQIGNNQLCLAQRVVSKYVARVVQAVRMFLFSYSKTLMIEENLEASWPLMGH